MPLFSVITSKIFGAAVLALLLVVAVQQFQLRGYRADLAECRVATVTLGKANEDQAALIDRLTTDRAAFEKRAADAEKARAKTEATAAARVKAALKRLTDAATDQDRQLTAPAIRSAIGGL